jgi:hypothetical protein
VPRIGITGHRGLNATTSTLVGTAIRENLHGSHRGGDLVGVTCLADGADTIFAQAVRDLGGAIEVIVPAARYREGLPVEHHPTYDRLLAAASAVYRLDYEESDSEAHMAASLRMIDMISELFAVWDGKPARGYGGTADVVAAASRKGRSVVVLWPEGSARD